MSTPKKSAAKSAKTDSHSGGKGESRCHVFASDKDGNVRDATAEELATAERALITVSSKTDDGVKILATYDCRIKHFESGNIGLAIRTSDTLDDTEVDNPDPHSIGAAGENKKITLVGRGNPLGAALALTQCYRAYGASFGQEFAYRMVRMDLDRDSKNWKALFVPAMQIATM